MFHGDIACGGGIDMRRWAYNWVNEVWRSGLFRADIKAILIRIVWSIDKYSSAFVISSSACMKRTTRNRWPRPVIFKRRRCEAYFMMRRAGRKQMLIISGLIYSPIKHSASKWRRYNDCHDINFGQASIHRVTNYIWQNDNRIASALGRESVDWAVLSASALRCRFAWGRPFISRLGLAKVRVLAVGRRAALYARCPTVDLLARQWRLASSMLSVYVH